MRVRESHLPAPTRRGRPVVTAGLLAMAIVALALTPAQALHHAGTIAVDEIWLAADNPHVITGVDDDEGDDVLPRMTAVFQNCPNPFNPRTEIRFDLKAPAPVSLQVYNVAGDRVATLVNEIMASGQHRVDWFGTDDQGRALASGVYLYRFRADDVTEVRRMMLVR